MDKTYLKILKEAILTESGSEFLNETDTENITNTVDIKGPMLQSILDYDGNGEIQTNKSVSAADIIEQFYFESSDSVIETLNEVEATEEKPVDNELDGEMDDDDDIDDMKDDIKDDIVENYELDDGENSINEMENKIIDKLIEEMDEEISGTNINENTDFEVSESETSMIDKFLFESDVDDDDDDDDDEELDVDAEVGDSSEEIKEDMAIDKVMPSEDMDDDEDLNESFDIFKESIEDMDLVEEITDMDSDDVII